MTYTEILAQLPVQLARSLQAKLENAAVSTHLNEDEVREIVDALVEQVRAEARHGPFVKLLDDTGQYDAACATLDVLFSQITNAVIDIIFA